MNPKQFLLLAGVVLVIVGILGFVGVIGPTSDSSVFGNAWWFDNLENWAHLVIGVVGLLASFVLPSGIQKPLVVLLGVVVILVGVYSIFNQNLFGANLENPADTILHIAVGAWGLFAGLMGKGKMNI